MGWMRAIEAVSTREKKWAELIRQQQQSGISVSAFCRDRGFSDQTFYNWRRRLAGGEPVRFALGAAGTATSADQSPIELQATDCALPPAPSSGKSLALSPLCLRYVSI